MQQPSFLARKTSWWPHWPNYFLLAMLVAFLLALMPRGARRAIESNTNKAEDWLPPGYAESVDLRWFRDYFLGEQFALVSWDGCTLGDTEKLEKLARSLVPTPQALAKAGPDSDLQLRAQWYGKIITGPQVLQQLTDSVGYGEAVKRLDGALVGPVQRDAEGKSLGNDSRATCLIVYLTEAATGNNRTMRKAIEKISEIASAECGIAPETIHMGGPPVDNITIDVEGERTLIRLAGLSGIVGLTLSFWCFRSIKLTGIVFAVGVLSAGMSLAIVFYFGILEVMFTGMATPRLGTVDAILMSMPAVVYVLGLSGAIHIVNYYRDARRENGIPGAAETAVKLGWGPCALAAFTTAVGLGSLYTSDILPIKKFGMFTAIGVMATVALLFSILPVFLHRFPVSEELIRRQSGGSGKNGKGGGRDDSHLPGWAKRMFGFVIHRPLLTCAIWFAVMGVFATGFTKIETSVSLLKLLDEDTDLIHDYAWLETNLGNLVPMEIVLTVPVERCRTADENAEADGRQYRDTMLERLNMVRDIQRRVEALPEVSRNMSVATYTPNRTDSGNPIVNQGTDYAKNKSLEESRAKLIETGYLRVEKLTDDAGHQTTGRELWRLSARVAALGEDSEGVDYGDFVKELKKAVDPILVAYQQRDMIVTALHQAEKKLDGAQLCLLYRSRSETSELQESSQEFVLRDLLKRSGVEQRAGKNTGLTTFNLAKLDKHKDDAEYMDRVIELLSKQDALLIVSASSDPQVKNLAKRGLPVIDVSKVQVYSDSAAIPLATDNGPRPIRAVYTGMIPLVYKTQRQLLVSLRESILWATVLIAVVMMFVLHSPLAGLISMIPNVFPIVIIFGLLGWVGIKVDIGIMMTASVALGVAVDDTVHFLTWFRRGVKQGLDRVQAVMLAYDRCATAMLQTTVIGGLGLAVFATSTFTPTQQFGYLMISMLGAALVGDLLLLPAILVGPLGKFFGGPAPAAGATTDWNQAPALHASSAAQTVEPAQLGEKPTEPTANPAETVGSESPLAAAVGQEAETEEPQELIEGPHAALHAKLRSLRRDEHRQDSVSS